MLSPVLRSGGEVAGFEFRLRAKLLQRLENCLSTSNAILYFLLAEQGPETSKPCKKKEEGEKIAKPEKKARWISSTLNGRKRDGLYRLARIASSTTFSLAPRVDLCVQSWPCSCSCCSSIVSQHRGSGAYTERHVAHL